MSLLTSEFLTDISPQNLQLPEHLKNAISAIVFRDTLYLATIVEESPGTQAGLDVRRYNATANEWIVLATLMPSPAILLANSDSASSLAEPNLQILGSEMWVVQGAQATATLYLRVILSSSLVQLWRSDDGQSFYLVDQASTPSSDRYWLGCQSYQGKLYTIARPIQDSVPLQSKLCVADQSNPTAWELLSAPGAEDASNQAVSDIAVFNGALYAATVNSVQGFQIWQTEQPDQANPAWSKVLSKGAYRYAINAQVFHLTPFQGCLYVASGMPNAEALTVKDFYADGFELLRLYPDGDWDLLIGTPKFTPQGLKVPLSAVGPGFDDSFNRTVQALIVDRDRLYLASQGKAGFQISGTESGEEWSLVSTPELSSYYQVQVHTVLPLSLGLVWILGVSEPTGNQRLQIWLNR
jgi:hypothetical protein